MKIQVNTAETLQKLISEDPTFEVEIKNAIINKIAKSYVKSIDNNEVIDNIRKLVDQTLYESKYSYGNYTAYVKQQFNNNIREQIQETIKTELSKIISKEILNLQDECIAEIKKRCNEYVSKIFPEILAEEFLKNTKTVVNGIINNTTKKLNN
jgi:uncharacterized circularly permuted ATP-grasp superfamily protein